MAHTRLRLLVVDDEPSLRTSLSLVLRQLGYDVRSAGNGFAALSEVREEIPDILLSDLNMPGMSGFELLSVVRRRFPAILAIAMSSIHSGDGVPPGVAADAFYEKGTAVSYLLEMLKAMACSARLPSIDHSSASAPIWIPRNGHDPAGEPYVTICCPECLRAFPQALNEDVRANHETDCMFCGVPIYYAIVQPTNSAAPPESMQPCLGGSSRPPGDGMLRSPRAL